MDVNKCMHSGDTHSHTHTHTHQNTRDRISQSGVWVGVSCYWFRLNVSRFGRHDIGRHNITKRHRMGATHTPEEDSIAHSRGPRANKCPRIWALYRIIYAPSLQSARLTATCAAPQVRVRHPPLMIHQMMNHRTRSGGLHLERTSYTPTALKATETSSIGAPAAADTAVLAAAPCVICAVASTPLLALAARSIEIVTA